MTPRLILILTAILLLFSIDSLAATGGIESGDRLRLTVLGASDLTGEVSVNPEGNISLPMVGSYKIAGKTTDEASNELRSVLRKWVKDPQVTLEVVQKATSVVVVSGRVLKPGAYGITQHTTLLEIIGLAGGADTNADLSIVNIIHSGTNTPETVNLRQFMDGKSNEGNPSLTNGDMVMVPEQVSAIGTIFVLGEVKRIGSYDLHRGMRIHEAIGQAGGTTDMADPQAASLKNKDGEPVKFDLIKALAQDPVEDKILASGDTIYIQPTSGTINIFGAVNRPGSYPIKQSLILTDALALAGGYTPRARIKDAKILRSSQQKSIPVNIANVEMMKAENIAVLPGDTIVIPERGEKTNIWQVISAMGSLGWLIF